MGDRVVRMYTFAARQPAWVTRVALGAMALAMTLVVLLLVIPAALIFVTVFLLGALIAKARQGWRRLFGQPDQAGRRNVRVIVHRHG